MSAAVMQIEFWIPKGRKGGAWVQSDALPAGRHDSRTWRKVKPGHSHKDKLAHSIAAVRSRGYATGGKQTDAHDKCLEYCQWARLKGLRNVTAFAGDWRSVHAAQQFGYVPLQVDVAEFIGPAPEPVRDDAP